MLANLFGIRGGLPELPRPGRISRKHRSDLDKVPLGTAVWLVAAVGVERVFNRKVADRVERRFGSVECA